MLKKPMLIEKKIEIKAYDIDVTGIVSNIVYVRWFEDLRHSFLDKYYPYKGMIESNQSPILTKTEIEYKIPLTIYDSPLGRCWMSNMGRSKWDMAFEILSGETIHCFGKQLGCFFDLKKKKPILLPQSMVLQYKNEMKMVE
jgi:acyl-CoA thioester hydrolase